MKKWHVKLADKSSYLTTFHTPFGRYRWRRMPFGISSASQVFQWKMHEFAKGLTGIEVIPDDFLYAVYPSCALTPVETKYAQIETEILAIVFAYDRSHLRLWSQGCQH